VKIAVTAAVVTRARPQSEEAAGPAEKREGLRRRGANVAINYKAQDLAAATNGKTAIARGMDRRSTAPSGSYTPLQRTGAGRRARRSAGSVVRAQSIEILAISRSLR
jgi:hypothetical protein